jgi:hypothetical protein
MALSANEFGVYKRKARAVLPINIGISFGRYAPLHKG